MIRLKKNRKTLSQIKAFQWNYDRSSDLYWSTGCNFAFENDLISVKIGINESLCGSACAKLPECTHFNWGNYFGGTCWLKKNSVSKDKANVSSDPNAACGLLSSSEIENKVKWDYDTKVKFNWAMDCDWKDNNLTNKITAPELCGSECAQTPRCTHFTWSDYLGGTCWMKQGFVTKTNVISKPNSNFVCGFIFSSKGKSNLKPISSSKFFVYSVGYFFEQPQKRTDFIIKQSNRKQFGVMVQIEELEFFKHCQKETLSKILHNPRSPRFFSFESALIAFYGFNIGIILHTYFSDSSALFVIG
ncbi:SCP-like extracellular [Brachionus plicatilis]|uniref:SCP-like extracellular n=1 Tax=Brachionus plicatilis TaxID=10195 RepID=A0A3M7PUQ9_BRAPC|nr:SCP-like extracellular [Brachionus plicatilis]